MNPVHIEPVQPGRENDFGAPFQRKVEELRARFHSHLTIEGSENTRRRDNKGPSQGREGPTEEKNWENPKRGRQHIFGGAPPLKKRRIGSDASETPREEITKEGNKTPETRKVGKGVGDFAHEQSAVANKAVEQHVPPGPRAGGNPSPESSVGFENKG